MGWGWQDRRGGCGAVGRGEGEESGEGRSQQRKLLQAEQAPPSGPCRSRFQSPAPASRFQRLSEPQFAARSLHDRRGPALK